MQNRTPPPPPPPSSFSSISIFVFAMRLNDARRSNNFEWWNENEEKKKLVNLIVGCRAKTNWLNTVCVCMKCVIEVEIGFFLRFQNFNIQSTFHRFEHSLIIIVHSLFCNWCCCSFEEVRSHNLTDWFFTWNAFVVCPSFFVSFSQPLKFHAILRLRTAQ